MENRGVRLLGHPVHPMLVVFPLGLLATSLVFDIAYLSTHNGTWGVVSFWMIVAGLIGGLYASPPDIIEATRAAFRGDRK